MIWLDGAGTILDGQVGDGLRTLCDRHSLVGSCLADAMPAEAAAAVVAALRRVAAGGRPETVRIRDGRVGFEARLVPTEAGHCMMSLAVARGSAVLPAAEPAASGDPELDPPGGRCSTPPGGTSDGDGDAITGAEMARQSEARARMAELRLRDAIECVTDGFVLWDRDDRLVMCNRRYEELYRKFAGDAVAGMSYEELLRRFVRGGGLAQSVADESAWVAARVGTRRATESESFERQLGDGRWVRIANHRTSDGGVVATHSDITELKRREAELRASEARARQAEARLRDAIESVSEAIVIWDRDDRLSLCNQQFLQTYPELRGHVRPGVRSEEVAWQLARSGRIVEAIGREAAWVAERCRQRADGGVGRFERRLADGHWVRLTSHRTSEGGIVSNHTDITELKEREAQLREREAQLRGIIDNIPGAVFRRVRRPDGSIQFPYHSHGVLGRYGITAGRIAANPNLFIDAIHPDDRARWFAAVARSAEDLTPFELNFRLVRRDGTVRWLRSMAQPRRSDDGSVVWDGISLDITELKETVRALRDSEERCRRLIEAAPVAILTHRQGRVAFANTAALRLFGAHRSADLTDRLAVSLVHPDDRTAALACVERLRAVGDTAPAHEMRVLRLDGRAIEVESTAVAIPDGGDVAIQTVVIDVTERNRAQARVQHLAHHDVLTGLPNRALLSDRLRQALAAARRERHHVAVVMVDLDRFKDVNDTFGHPFGDRLLCAVAERLRGTVRASDTLARFGGDEFVLVQARLHDPAGACVLAEKLSAVLGEPFLIDGEEVHTGASVGVALHPEDGDDPDRLIEHADLALYRAKAVGRDGVEFFNHDLNQGRQLARFTAEEFRHALACGQSSLQFRPQCELTTGRIVAVEALFHWQHPERGLLKPAEVVSAAEGNDLIRALGRCVLEGACRAARTWQEAGYRGRVVVPLCILQCREDHLPHDVQEALTGVGLAADLLEVAVGEDLLVAAPHLDRALGNLHRLARLGVGLAITGFGTGCSSLARIGRLPITTIELDASVVRGIGSDPQDEAVARAVVALGRSLGKRVVAEGVGTAGQLAFLAELGCHDGEGAFLGEPMSDVAIAARLADQANQPAPEGALSVSALDERAQLPTLGAATVRGEASWRSNGSTTTPSACAPTSWPRSGASTSRFSD